MGVEHTHAAQSSRGLDPALHSACTDPTANMLVHVCQEATCRKIPGFICSSAGKAAGSVHMRLSS